MEVISKIEELQGIIDLLMTNTSKDIEDFPIMTADEIMDSANNKDNLLREFIIVKGELDLLMNGKEKQDIMKYESVFIDLEEKMMQFKILNRRLMLLTIPIQEMYNDMSDRVKKSPTGKKNSLNTSI